MKKLTKGLIVGVMTEGLVCQPAGDTGTNRMAIVLLHGGRFTEGHKNEYTRISTDLAKRGFVVFSINYRNTWLRCICCIRLIWDC